jgi:heme-degrading monooxygenase HmoA
MSAGGATTVTEHALLQVIPGQEDEFIATMDHAKSIIAASPGFASLRVERCVERPNCFLLLVDWESLEAHTEGFRGSEAYQEWRALLHHFYDPFPVVEHFEVVLRA